MNRLLLFICSIFFGVIGHTQEMLDTITQETCDCISGKNLANLNAENLNLVLGTCMIESLGRHESAMKELNINLHDADGMRQLGEKVGLRMATICPDILLKIAELSQPQPTTDNELLGTIVRTGGEEFGFVIVRDEQGREHKLLWLRYFKNSEQLIQNPQQVIGKRVRIHYEAIECYTPKEREYFERKEIKRMEFQ